MTYKLSAEGTSEWRSSCSCYYTRLYCEERGILDRISKNESHTERNNLPTGSLNQYNAFLLFSFLRFTFEFGTEAIRNHECCFELLTAGMSREKFESSVLFCVAALCWRLFCVLHCVSE